MIRTGQNDFCLVSLCPGPKPLKTRTRYQEGAVPAQGRQQQRGLGGLLASVASAAHGRCMKRAGSAHNLALPTATITGGLGGGGGEGAGSASLPPSPHHSPAITRKVLLNRGTTVLDVVHLLFLLLSFSLSFFLLPLKKKQTKI